MYRVRLYIGLLFAFGSFLTLILAPSASAATSGLVISHILVGESTSSSSEFIAVYNNTSVDIDITGFCLKNKAPIKFACITADANAKVYIRSHNYLTIASTTFNTNHNNYTPDTSYSISNAIQVTSDTITLVDPGDIEVDQVGWGSSGTKPETNMLLQRRETAPGSGIKSDTNIISTDFESVALTAPLNVPANASYDVITIVDICTNIVGTQQTMPSGYLADENGNCQPDSCINIAGLQISVPEGYDSDSSGNCAPHDECENLTGVQTVIPAYMIRGNEIDCIWDIPQILLTEILPNPIGADTGNEFIEIYNPTNKMVDLSFYSIKTGTNLDKTYAFPLGAMIAPNEHRTFIDTLMKFTLVNTSSRVILSAADGSTLSDTGIYNTPLDGESWAWIDNAWQYTNQPSPGAANLISLVEEVQIDATDSGLSACPAGKYRNPLTNRCRNITTDSAVLASCDTDQYRNPETGRCRKIENTSLTPCKEGQYRSEETNRCRSIQTASTAKPCKDNQYRSEETNRCRNLPASSVPEAAFAVQPIKDTGLAFIGWWALGGVALLAGGYAIWEWRRELVVLLAKMNERFRTK